LLARELAGRQLRYSYRFLFAPATLGAIAWLARNENRLDRVRHGLVCCCVGDPGPLAYKKSRSGSADVDRATQLVLRESGEPFDVREWEPWGSDERQYNSPGFDLDVGTLTRSAHGSLAEYHSSADDLELVRPEALAASFRAYMGVFDVLETNEAYVNLSPKGEPQLGRRGLFRPVGGATLDEVALLWVLNLSDGKHTLLDIAVRSGLPFAQLRSAAQALLDHELLRVAT